MAEATVAKKKYPVITTPRALGSYVNLAKPRAMEEGKEEEYGLALLWTKDQDLTGIKQAILDCAVAKWGSNAPQLFAAQRLKTPLKDGNSRVDDAGNVDPIYKDKIVLNARSKTRVEVVDHNMVVQEPSTLYSGMFFQAQLQFYSYEYKGPTGKGPIQSRGVGCGLQNLMLVGRGKRIDGREDARTAFKDLIPDVMPDMDGEGLAPDLDDLIGR